MDFIKTLKKKTEAKISDIKSEFKDSSSIPRLKPNFDYEALQIAIDCGPYMYEYYYEMDFDLTHFLKRYNFLYPTANIDESKLLATQLETIAKMREQLLAMPIVEHVSQATQTKRSKLHSQQPVKEITLEEIYYCNDLILFRFLRSYDYKVEKSLNLLLKTLSWRRTRDPLRLPPERVEQSVCKNMLYRRGFDYFACPLIYFRPVNETPISFEIHVLALYYTLERALQTCILTQGNDKVYVIVDLKDWSLTRLPPMDLVLETARAIVEHYTETVDEILFVDPPPMTDAVFQMVKCVIPTSTAKKLSFKSRGPKLFQYLKDRIPPCFLEKSLGGDCDPDPDHKVYWKIEESQYKYFQDKVDQWIAENKHKYIKTNEDL
ncbi:hypothetical protein MACJ_004008 [Theileria orientalis]|uniref:CRAL-TRIO domain-containing protein n=1 Tax=Theileria orientalis TaxID=68886 RepID=A0A976SL83_THEOR|nr:hypothetical protein MACJ_004008 [Theileria orientalis]